jgi:FMN reductase [NAD(P)H]
MDLYDLLMSRRSVRHYEDRAIPQEIVGELLDVSVHAPSGGNIQPLSVIAVQDPGRKEELSRVVGRQPWVKNAPLCLVFCIDFSRIKQWASMFGVDFQGDRALGMFLIAYADVMCSAQTVAVLAQARGLGSVYVGTVQSNTKGTGEILKTPEYVLPMMILCLGYPKSVPSEIPKLDRDFMVHRETYRTATADEVLRGYEEKYGKIHGDIERYFERAYVEVMEAERQGEAGWIEHAKERMEKLNITSSAEFLFRLRYPTDLMAGLNQRLIAAYREAGFDVFS